jgi:hypothetical protein
MTVDWNVKYVIEKVCSKDTTLPLIVHELKSKCANYEFEKLQDS